MRNPFWIGAQETSLPRLAGRPNWITMYKLGANELVSQNGKSGAVALLLVEAQLCARPGAPPQNHGVGGGVRTSAPSGRRPYMRAPAV